MSSAYDIQGRNCVFQLKIGDEYKDVVCAKTFSLNVTTEMKDTTTVGGLGTGWWKEKRPRKLEYTITFNGTVQVLADDDKPTIKTMFQNQIWFLPMDYRMYYTDNSDNVMVLLGRVYNANTVINANPINLLDGTVELQGTGAIEPKDALPNPVNLKILMVDDGTGTQVGKARLVLLDAEGAIVFQTDDLPQAVGGYLEGPAFDITTQIEAGEYYYTWYTYTETDANLFHLDDPPGVTTAFASGFQEGTSYPDTIHDFTAAREVSFSLGPTLPPPACVDVAIVGTPALPDGEVGQAYSYSFAITGSAPFVLTNVTKPSWMTITIDQTNKLVIFTGTPDATGTGVTVSFDITNCTAGTVSFSDTIDVAAAADPITVDYEFDESGIGANGTFRLYVNSVEVVFHNSDATGQITVNPGDVVEAMVVPASGQRAGLVVDDSIDGVIHFDPLSLGTKQFDWVAQSGHDYEVIADVSP